MCNYLKKPLSFKQATRPPFGKWGETTYKMKNTIAIFLILFSGTIFFAQAQDEEPVETEDYVEFNDRNNVVHGVYLGLGLRFGEIDGKETAIAGLKVAYVANQQFEIGFEGNFLYSDQNLTGTFTNSSQDLLGAYGGLHLEPILFSKSRVNLSFPVLIGAGAIGYVDADGEYIDEQQVEREFEDANAIFVLEPGINMLVNVNRYLQIEVGMRYRLSSNINLSPSPITRINGFSAGIGVKVGVFNMGRNRYKKNIDDGE